MGEGDGPRFRDAGEMIAQGWGQRWYRYVHPFERDMLIESEVRVNYERGARGQTALRHYVRGGHIVFCEGPFMDAEPHPEDVKKQAEELRAKLAALGEQAP